MTPPDSEMIAELKRAVGAMTPGEWEHSETVGFNNWPDYKPQPPYLMEWMVNGDGSDQGYEPARQDADARAIVLLRNYASRLIELAEKGMEKEDDKSDGQLWQVQVRLGGEVIWFEQGNGGLASVEKAMLRAFDRRREQAVECVVFFTVDPNEMVSVDAGGGDGVRASTVTGHSRRHP